MTPDILCIGAVLWDIIGRTDRVMGAGADVPGRIAMLPGGVACNLARTFAGFGLRPALLTAIGRDAEGTALIAACAAEGMVMEFVCRDSGFPTDRYMAIESCGALVGAIADARGLEAAGAAILAPMADGRLGSTAAPWAGPIVLDGNLTAALLAEIAASPLFARAQLRAAPASPGKADRLRCLLGHPSAVLHVNLVEAGILAGRPFDGAAEAAAALVAGGARRALVTDGAGRAADATAEGVIWANPPRVTVARVTGAGDTFMAAHLVAERRGLSRAAALEAALSAAATYVAGGTPR